MISSFRRVLHVVCFLLGNYPASGVYMPTFRNTLFHLHRQVDVSRISTHVYLPMKMEQTECSETSTYKLQTPGNYPKESIQHAEHGESLKSRIVFNSFTKSLQYQQTHISPIMCFSANWLLHVSALLPSLRSWHHVTNTDSNKIVNNAYIISKIQIKIHSV